MPVHVREPTVVPAIGEPPKLIRESAGLATTGTAALSVARTTSPAGWSEPAQTPELVEVTIVLDGADVVSSDEGTITVRAGEALVARPGERIRYSTPDGAEHVAICVPAFSPETVHRDPSA